jgi:hypothetical protein
VTGTGGSTKTSTLSQTVTCSDCSTGGTTSSGGGGGGGAGGATTTAVTPVTELTKSLTSELGKDELLGFSFGGANHTLTVLNITDTTATIQIESAPQILTLALEEERQIDLNADGVNDISLKLKSINTITKKATFVLTPLNVLRAQGGGEETGTGGGGRGAPTTTKTEPGGGKSSINYILIILVALIAIVLIAIGIKLAVKAKREKI